MLNFALKNGLYIIVFDLIMKYLLMLTLQPQPVAIAGDINMWLCGEHDN
jgi:hypothetical protein